MMVNEGLYNQSWGPGRMRNGEGPGGGLEAEEKETNGT